jgi:para-nitrobenzyl esterase
MNTAGVSTLEEFRQLDAKTIFTALEEVKARRKDNTYNTMPVVDGYLISAPVDQLIAHPLPVDYMIGYTNNDMFAIIMAHISHKYAKANHAYLYYFDIDAPGDDNNGAFHSSDLRYVFGTLQNSHRPYTKEDNAVSELMVDYLCHFAETGDPNHAGAPHWEPAGSQALHIVNPVSQIKMGRPSQWKLLVNTLTKGDPK